MIPFSKLNKLFLDTLIQIFFKDNENKNFPGDLTVVSATKEGLQSFGLQNYIHIFWDTFTQNKFLSYGKTK